MDVLLNSLTLIGGLAMFLFGMSIMGTALEKRAGYQLKTILGKLTSNKFKGFLLGLGVTAIIQSSSATTVMVVGFVNSGVMSLSQSIGVILGANLGTSVTSWILSLTGIDGSGWISLLKPSSFTPVLAFIGIIFYMFMKSGKKKDTGLILIGFAILMFGMETMSAAVQPLAELPAFQSVLVAFKNPLLGLAVGIAFTAIIQSSSASVGILQALTMTGTISYMTAIPIIMGQNIGTCVSAMISSIGATKNARRAAFVHLYFNLIAAVILMVPFYILTFGIPAINNLVTNTFATPLGIAVAHTTFKIIALIILSPFTKLLEKLACLTVRDSDVPEEMQILDERLLATPSIAIERAREVANTMAELSCSTLKDAFAQLGNYNDKKAEKIFEGESKVDMYEDKLGTYLVKLSSRSMTMEDSHEVSKLLHIIGDFERISDHAVNILESAQEMYDKKQRFSNEARSEITVIISAVTEALDLAQKAFVDEDIAAAEMVEPLEQTVDFLKSKIKSRHIRRLQKNDCTIEMGFVLSDLLNNLERVSDHCSNIAVCIIEIEKNSFDTHEYLGEVKAGNSPDFTRNYESYMKKYAL